MEQGGLEGRPRWGVLWGRALILPPPAKAARKPLKWYGILPSLLLSPADGGSGGRLLGGGLAWVRLSDPESLRLLSSLHFGLHP